MKCPKCALSRALYDRVCRRCKYLFDEDRFIGIEPPRGGASRPRAESLGSRGRALMLRMRSRRWVILAAALVPGLGHALSGNRLRGLVFFGLIPILASLSVLYFSSTQGQVLFGLAVSAHAYSIFDLAPGSRSAQPGHRALAMGRILGGLLVLYWPLLTHLANLFVRPQRVQGDAAFGPGPPLAGGQIIFMVILFVVSIWFSAWLGRRLSSKDPWADA